MNISKVIKEQRSRLSLSQEELAEKLYVTRHTIGNWENNRSYPDIHSLILLFQIFELTIDHLIKGDLEMMNQIIEEKDIRHLIEKLYSWNHWIRDRSNFSIYSADGFLFWLYTLYCRHGNRVSGWPLGSFLFYKM